MDTRKFKIASYVTPEEFERDTRTEAFEECGLFNFAVRAMRFSYDYLVATDISTLLPNGSWTGEIGLLNRSEVDYSPSPFVVTAERWEAVAFNYPYACDDLTFVSKRPRYQPESMAIFRTVSGPVWSTLFASIIFVTSVLFLVLKYRHYTLDDIMLHVLATGLNQGGSLIPHRFSEVLLLCTWMLSMTIFTACFKSVLLSFLSFPPLTGVRTVPELASAIRKGQYSAMTEKDDYTPIYLQESSNENIRLIGENAIGNPPGTAEDLLNKSFSPKGAIVYARSEITYAKEKLYVSEDSMGFFLTATAVRKDFCCRDEMDMIVHRFLAAGINLKIRRFSEFNKAFKAFSGLSYNEELRKITMADISAAFLFLFAGLFLSACTLLFELAMKSRTRHRSSAV